MSDHNLGLDLGYGYTKAFNLDNAVSFPTAVKELTEETTDPNAIVVEVDGEPYLVSESALYDLGSAETRHSGFLGSPKWVASLCGAIIRHGYPLSSIDKPVVVIGVPPREHDKETIKRLKDTLATTKVSYNGKKFSLGKVRFFIIPQGTAIFFAYLNENPSDRDKTTVVADLGYMTLDLVVFRDGIYEETASQTYTLGTSYLVDEISKRFFKTYHSPINRFDVSRLISDGAIDYFGDKVKLPGLDKLIDAYRKKIATTISCYVESLNFGIHNAILAGGGANLFMKDGLPKKFKVVSDPMMSNAKGYWLYAGDVRDENL